MNHPNQAKGKISPLIILPILFFLSGALLAQNPGGISTVPQFWIKADYSAGKMTLAAGKISDWTNEKSTFKISQITPAKQPIWYSGSTAGASVDSLNYSPHVTFLAGTQNHLTNAAISPDLLGTAGTTFTVSNQDGGSKSAVTYLSNNLFRYQIKPNFRVQTSNGIAIATPLSSALGYTSDFSSTYNSPRSNARITTSRGFASTLTSRRNGTPYAIVNSNIAPYCPGIGVGTFVGGNPTNTEYFDGKIAEVIFYNTVLSDADVQKVESYLAIKYGITINPAGLDALNGYVSSGGTSIYSKGSDGTAYWNSIVGLGRDDNTVLLQKQSHQYDDSVRLYSSSLAATNTANTASVANNTFMMMGSNTGKLCENIATAFEVPSVSLATIRRLDREWKIINTGYNLPYTIEFKLNACISAADWTTGTKMLLVDDDGNFTNAAQVLSGTSGVTINYNPLTTIFTATIDPASSGGLFGTAGVPKYITPAVINFWLLPVNVLSFTAIKTNAGAKLNWVTVTDPELNYFEVEKSYDNSLWKKIATVYKKATTAAESAYEFIDKETSLTGKIYYRIKQINNNGSISYLPVRTVYTPAAIDIFPNPATKKITVSWQQNNRPDKIRILSYTGKVINVPFLKSESSAEIDISNLPAGIYAAALTINNTVSYKKFIKK